MTKTDSICYTQDLPKVIQNVLFEHGEKKPIGQSQWLRTFSLSVFKKLNRQFNQDQVRLLIEFSNAYIVHSNDDQTVITMGKYVNH